MENNKQNTDFFNKLKNNIIISFIILGIIILTFFQTCSVRNNNKEQALKVTNKIDSISTVINNYQVEVYKINVNYLTELQNLTYSMSLKNKDELIQKQQSVINSLNAKIKQNKNKEK